MSPMFPAVMLATATPSARRAVPLVEHVPTPAAPLAHTTHPPTIVDPVVFVITTQLGVCCSVPSMYASSVPVCKISVPCQKLEKTTSLEEFDPVSVVRMPYLPVPAPVDSAQLSMRNKLMNDVAAPLVNVICPHVEDAWHPLSVLSRTVTSVTKPPALAENTMAAFGTLRMTFPKTPCVETKPPLVLSTMPYALPLGLTPGMMLSTT